MTIARRAGLACAAAALAVMVIGGVDRANARTGAERPVVQSTLGSYLAARIARGQNDTLAAAKYYGRALDRTPPSLKAMRQAFLMEAANGNIDRAGELARALVDAHGPDNLAQLYIAVSSMKAGDPAAARAALGQRGGDGALQALVWSSMSEGMRNRVLLERPWVRRRYIDGLVGDTRGIVNFAREVVTAWIEAAEGKVSVAIDRLTPPRTRVPQRRQAVFNFFKRYHRGLVAELHGRRRMADQSFSAVMRRDPRAVRAPFVYAHALAARGDRKRAIAVIDAYTGRRGGRGHPLTDGLRKDVMSGGVVQPIVNSSLDGIGELFFGLGEALVSQNNDSEPVSPLGILFLQLAINVREPSPSALIELARAYEIKRRYGDANDLYEQIPETSPLYEAVQIRRAWNYSRLKQVDDAKRVLTAKIERGVEALDALSTLATILRISERFGEAIGYYSRAIDMAGKPTRQFWSLWYGRGVALERSKQWDKAEADLLLAKKLNPNEPLVLNYLGYSWVDQDRNLKEGLAMIKRAVALKPNDGHITDSLGWAYYKLRDYENAVKYLAEAVRLRPSDPILNDHLGDALWKIGRKREAQFQWNLALGFEPEPEDEKKIRQKLARGLELKPRGQPIQKTERTDDVRPVR